MQAIEALYLSGVAIGMSLVYIALYFCLQLFLKKKVQKLNRASLHSILVIVMLSIALYIVSYYVISDPDWGNRFLHAFGGGFMVLFTTLLAVRDTKASLSKAATFFLAWLLVMMLGLFNEVIELLLQDHLDYIFAPSLEDTLLDLLSNTIGFLIGSICILPVMINGYLSNRKRTASRR